MKRKNFIILLIFVLSLLFSCCWGPKEKADSEIFTSIEPMEWSEDYIVSASNYPSSILIWDSKTNKLVREISLQKEKRAITILDMKLLDKTAWLIGEGKSTNLIRINFETGEIEFKDFSYEGSKERPYSLGVITREEDSVGTIWVKSYGNPENGTLFDSYNSDGTLRERFCLEGDITDSEMAVIYQNGKYYMIGAIYDSIIVSDSEQESYKIVNLTDKNYKTARNNELFDSDFISKIYNGLVINKFLTDAKFYKNNLMSINIATGYIPEYDMRISSRLYYNVISYDPFDAEYMNIKMDNVSAIESYQSDSDYFIIVNPRNQKKDIKGLCIKAYDKKTLKQKELTIENSNQIYLLQKNNATWISMDSYKYVGDGCVTEPAIPEICKLDHETGRVFVYSEDGIGRELSYTDVSE